MNKEHGESLSHYLEYYGKIGPSAAAVDPAITAFTSPEMVIEYGKPGKRQKYHYKFKPPMGPGQARKRLEEMHQEAKAGLDLSDITINTFNPDKSLLLTLLIGTAIQAWIAVVDPLFIAKHMPRLTGLLARTVLPSVGAAITWENAGTAAKLLVLVPWYFLHLIEVVTCLFPLFRRYNTKNGFVQIIYFFGTLSIGVYMWAHLKRQGESLEKEMVAKKEGPKGH
ncbi:integral membrane protein [Pseudohyphozyma bogoriensis]|nr:integral membrane protein [Pseudohyphozyma bogoriensis]